MDNQLDDILDDCGIRDAAKRALGKTDAFILVYDDGEGIYRHAYINMDAGLLLALDAAKHEFLHQCKDKTDQTE